MKYARHHATLSRPANARRKKISVFLVGAGILFLIYAGVRIGQSVGATRDIEKSEPESAVESININSASAGPSDIQFATQEVELVALLGYEASGLARRGIATDVFTNLVVAELPTYNVDSEFYEGWLVKPGVVEFFSTGEMYKREDGKFGLLWDANVADFSETVWDYSKVVITLEKRDGDPAPSPTHVLEGEFGD